MGESDQQRPRYTLVKDGLPNVRSLADQRTLFLVQRHYLNGRATGSGQRHEKDFAPVFGNLTRECIFRGVTMKQWISDTFQSLFRDLAKDKAKELVKQLAPPAMALLGSLGIWRQLQSATVPAWAIPATALATLVIGGLLRWVLNPKPIDPLAKPDGDYRVFIQKHYRGPHFTSSYNISWFGVNWTVPGTFSRVALPRNPQCPADGCELEPWERWSTGRVVRSWWRCGLCQQEYPRPDEDPYYTAKTVQQVLQARVDRERQSY